MEGATMTRLFTEATYEQLERLLKIIDSPSLSHRMDWGWMLKWAEGKQKIGNEDMITYWEQVARGEI
jgi:hypothetical protein